MNDKENLESLAKHGAAQTRHRVVLIRLANPNINLVTPPIGIGYILKSLAGITDIEPVFLDCKLKKIDNDSLIDQLISLKPLIVGFQLFSADYPQFKKLLPAIKQELPQCKIVAGGPHVSGLPSYTLRTNPDLDYVIAGEAEEAFPLLVKSIQKGYYNTGLEQIPNLVYRQDTSIIENPKKWIDVHEFGPPAWNYLKPEEYPAIQHGTFHKSNRVVPILTSRGCPYGCTFCSGHLVTGKKIRLRHVSSVIDEIEWLINTYGFKEFIVEDENFTFYKSHVIEFADELQRRNIHCWFSFPNGIRLDKLDEEIVSRLASMGTYMVCVGIESGSKETMKKMGKNWDQEFVRNRILLLKQYGIIVNASFIMGYRDETPDDIRQTIDFSLSLPIDTAYFGNYLPLPGSEDFEILIQSGELSLDSIQWQNYNSYAGVFPYHPRKITEQQLKKAIKKATLRFYLRPRIAFNILRRMTHFVFFKSFLSRLYGILLRS